LYSFFRKYVGLAAPLKIKIERFYYHFNISLCIVEVKILIKAGLNVFLRLYAGGRCYLNKSCARKRNYSESLRLQWLVHQGVFLMRKRSCLFNI
jgi:hypothetical protein